MSHTNFGCLLPLVDALAEAGNPYWANPRAMGPFYGTQGGYVCRMTYRIDFDAIRDMPRESGVELVEEIDQIFCRECWTVVIGGASTTLVDRRQRGETTS